MGEVAIYFLYESKKGVERRLVATFGSEQQLLANVRSATLEDHGEQGDKIDQGSALASCNDWEHSMEPLTDEDVSEVKYDPTPSML